MKFPVPFQNRQWETFSDCFDFFSWKLFTLSLAGGFFHYKRIFFIFLATKPEPQTSSLKCGLSNLDLKQLKQKLCFAFSLKNNNNSTQIMWIEEVGGSVAGKAWCSHNESSTIRWHPQGEMFAGQQMSHK